jgi:hypothetical protein
MLFIQCLHVVYSRARPFRGLNKFKNLRRTLAKNAKVLIITFLFLLFVNDLLTLEVFTVFIAADIYLICLTRTFPETTNRLRWIICLTTLGPFGFIILPTKKNSQSYLALLELPDFLNKVAEDTVQKMQSRFPKASIGIGVFIAFGGLAYLGVQAVDHYEVTTIENCKIERENELIKYNRQLSLKNSGHSDFNREIFLSHEKRIDNISDEISMRAKRKPIIVLVKLINENKPWKK